MYSHSISTFTCVDNRDVYADCMHVYTNVVMRCLYDVQERAQLRGTI